MTGRLGWVLGWSLVRKKPLETVLRVHAAGITWLKPGVNEKGAETFAGRSAYEQVAPLALGKGGERN